MAASRNISSASNSVKKALLSIWYFVPDIDDFNTRLKAQLLNKTILVIFGMVFAAGILNFLQDIYRPSVTANPGEYPAILMMISTLLISRLLLHREDYMGASRTLIVGTYIATVIVSVYLFSSFTYLITTILLAAIFLPDRETIIVGLVAFATPIIYSFIDFRTSITITIYMPVYFFVLSLPLLATYILHTRGLERERRRILQETNHRLQESEELLEQRVLARTRDLELAADVSKEVVSVIELDELLTRVAELTRTAFDLEHVSVFVYDAEQRLLSLEAGTGESGRIMIEAGTQFAIDYHKGLVSKAAREKQPIVVNDTSNSNDHLINPLFPHTRSEVALPMLVSGQLIGVLNLQSRVKQRFTPDDMRVLQTLTDQIAIALRNSQLFEDTKAAKEQAENADKVKSAFLASVSHELRTPLNAIINFTKFVAKGAMGPVNDEQRETLEEVIASGRHLLNLINDVLDMSKIGAGSLKLFVEPEVDLNDLLSSVQATASILLKDKPVKLQTDIQANLPSIMGDKQRIMQVMLNILSNACKFTDTGSVTITAHSDDDHVYFAVHDTGPGIVPEDQPLVFQPFQQTDTGLRKGGGTGLGMPISKSLVEAHGGNLTLESEPGKGSIFLVKLPIASEGLEPMLIKQKGR